MATTSSGAKIPYKTHFVFSRARRRLVEFAAGTLRWRADQTQSVKVTMQEMTRDSVPRWLGSGTHPTVELLVTPKSSEACAGYSRRYQLSTWSRNMDEDNSGSEGLLCDIVLARRLLWRWNFVGDTEGIWKIWRNVQLEDTASRQSLGQWLKA